MGTHRPQPPQPVVTAVPHGRQHECGEVAASVELLAIAPQPLQQVVHDIPPPRPTRAADCGRSGTCDRAAGTICRENSISLHDTLKTIRSRETQHPDAKKTHDSLKRSPAAETDDPAPSAARPAERASTHRAGPSSTGPSAGQPLTFAWSAKNCFRPLSVSGCLSSPGSPTGAGRHVGPGIETLDDVPRMADRGGEHLRREAVRTIDAHDVGHELHAVLRNVVEPPHEGDT